MVKRHRKILTRLPLAAALTLAVTPGLLGAAEPLTVADMVSLLQAGIGSDLVRMQAQRTGTLLDPDVEDLLALKSAGADETLLAFLMSDTSGSAPAPSSEDVRVFLDEDRAGGAALVLTNLDEGGRRLDGSTTPASRGVISSSERRAPPARPEQAAPAPTALLPATLDINLNRPVEDERLVQLEDRLRDLESDEDQRLPVGAGLPRHPINDFREYPVLPFGYSLGYGYALPVVRAQEATVTRYGPLPSFTSGDAAGIDPFRPVQPCSPGQACSVHQRLAYPYP